MKEKIKKDIEDIPFFKEMSERPCERIEEFVCPHCGSDDVLQKLWVETNTLEISKYTCEGEEDQFWCQKCDKTFPTVEVSIVFRTL